MAGADRSPSTDGLRAGQRGASRLLLVLAAVLLIPGALFGPTLFDEDGVLIGLAGRLTAVLSGLSYGRLGASRLLLVLAAVLLIPGALCGQTLFDEDGVLIGLT